MRKRVIQLESVVKELKERMDTMESMMTKLNAEKQVWKDAYDDLHKKLTLNEKTTMDCEEKVDELDVKQETSKKEQQEDKADFRKIIRGTN